MDLDGVTALKFEDGLREIETPLVDSVQRQGLLPKPPRKFVVNSAMRAILLSLTALAAPAPPELTALLSKNCAACHSGAKAQAGLDLNTLPFNLDDRSNRNRWIRIYDRVERGEMPPAIPIAGAAKAGILRHLSAPLHAADLADASRNGRGPIRRLNRDEYEQNLRDILQLPRLDIRDMLPEDREAHHFNKVSETLDMSRVQLTAYLDAAEAALRQAIATTPTPPETKTFRTFGRNLFPGLRSTGTRHSMFFIKDNKGVNVESEYGNRPMTKELEQDPALEMGLFRSPGWPYGAFPRGFAASESGMYKIRFSARAVLQQPGYVVSDAKRPLPMTLRSRRPTNHDIAEDTKQVGGILEILPGSRVYEMTVPLLKGQTVEYALLGLPVPQVDAEGKTGSYRFPPMPADGAPGVAFNWIEFEGPLAPETWPPPSHRVLFDSLGIAPEPADKKREASRLLRRFVNAAARRPLPAAAFALFDALIGAALERNESFVEAMLIGYQAFLCSNEFLYLREPASSNDAAERLSHFLANTRSTGPLANRAALHKEADRLIDAASFDRFVRNFSGYWLNLRHLRRDDADKRLYPEYQLDEYLVDSLERETLTFMTALIRENLPIRNLVESDHVYVNERLARHYGLPPVDGPAIRKVQLPKGSPLGGVLTQGAILKITANGTSTSPVLRGAWIMDRIVGEPPPPPPPSVPAVEPDIRGAKSIRELLAMHTKSATCAGCHAKFDPVGLALENFDVMGHWRTHYRGTAEGERVTGIDHTGHDFAYTIAGAVDPSGKLIDGRTFRDVRELKAIFAANPRRLARNFLHQLTVYATGTPVRFSDRAEIERLLDGCAPGGYRARDLLHALIGSRIFLGEKSI